MTRIVFSKDRALQLHAFLRSYQDHVSPHARMTVLYKASTLRHQAAYVEMFRAFPWAQPFRQSASFKADLLELLPADGPAILFADDHLFVRHWIEEEQPINLHLGLNLTWCYTLNRAQPLPSYELVEPDKVSWLWAYGQGDWNYPLCPCGHVFCLEEWRPLIAACDFTSPNTLEMALQKYRELSLLRHGLCYRQSKLVLLPWNRVQDECPNRIAANLPHPDQLVAQWEAGYQINVSALYGVQNESLHQELPLVLEAR